MGSITDAISAASGGLSAITAILAIVIAVSTEHRARRVAKVQMYLLLREGFLDIYKALGNLEREQPENPAAATARQAYWHHAYDEWYISKMCPSEFGDMWETFFRKAVLSGYGHPPLRAALEELAADTTAGFGAYAQDFVREFQGDANLRKFTGRRRRRRPVNPPRGHG